MEKTGARLWAALIAVAASMLVVGLDLRCCTRAPQHRHRAHGSTSDLQWFTMPTAWC